LKIFIPYINTFFFIIQASYWCQKHKRFYPDCMASSGHQIWIHPFQISIFWGAPSVVQTSENHWGLSQSCKMIGSWFPSSCFLMWIS
jgi:hypothetical protein